MSLLIGLFRVAVTTDFQMLSESSSLKLTAAALERSRFRHEPYARYATKVIT
jgi:hypothetical protein